MPDVKYFADLTPIVTILDDKIMAMENDPISGVTGFKTTALEVKDYVNDGQISGKTVTGGLQNAENLLLSSTSHPAKGQIQLDDGDLLHANTIGYEALVLDDNDIPNKKYVTQAIPDTVTEVLTVTVDGQTAFTLSDTPLAASESILTVNGQVRLYTTDFTISGTALTWNDPGGLTLETTDVVQIWYNVNLGSGGAPVSSVFGRIGTVVATASDYDASQVDNDSGVAGATVKDALDALDGAIAPVSSVFSRTGAVVAAVNDYAASEILDDSSLPTTNVKFALELLELNSGVSSVFGRDGNVTAALSDYDASQIDNDSSVTGATVKDALDTLDAGIPGTTREVFLAATDYNANFGSAFRTREIAATGAHRFTFKIPDDFNTLTSCDAIGVISSGAAGAGKNIDLTSEYGAVGETYNTHSETDTSILFDFTGKTNEVTAISLSTVLSSLSAGDYVGIIIDHNSIGGAIDYLGIKLVYTV